MSKLAKTVVDAAIASMMERPRSFRIDEHTIEDTNTGLQYWIANTWINAGVYRPFKFKFGAWHGIRFHMAVRRLKAYQALHLIRGAN